MKKYVKPTIQLTSLQNPSPYEGMKYGLLEEETIDNVPIQQIVRDHGSPVFVLSEKKLREKYQQFYDTFKSEYEKLVIGYSYKTNYLSTVCQILQQEGAWAEVVSGLEYEMAERLNVPGDHIIFNGCYKKPHELKKAILKNSIINVDSYDEMIQIEKIAIQLQKKIKIGLRINMNLTAAPWSKFGINLESGQAYEFCKRLYNSGVLKICGLHVHIATYIYDPILYSQAATQLASFASRLEEEFRFKIEYFDLGGGFPSENTLQSQFLPASYLVPKLSTYAKALCEPLKKFKSRYHIKPLLILEPGRALIDEAISCICTVVATKKISSSNQGVVIDAGINILPNCNWYDHDIYCIGKKEMSRLDTVIFGPLCMQIDVVRKHIKLPPLHRGEHLLIKNTGAYNITQSTQFIYERPAIVLVGEGRVDVIRRAETIDDIKRLESIPDRLFIKDKMKKAA